MRVFILIIFFFQTVSLLGEVTLPRIFSDGVILQRETELRIWGWASAGEELALTLGDQSFETITDQEGNWEIALPPQVAGGPYEIIIEASNKIIIHDILFGDVWVCSGQSNMELTMERVKQKYATEVSHSKNDQIRQFLVPDKYDFKREHGDLDGGAWVSAAPETLLGFSAVAYFYALALFEQYAVPIGIVNAAMGGSPVEAWMSEDALKPFPEAYNELQLFKKDSLIRAIQADDKNRSSQWYGELYEKDQGLKETPVWNQSGVDDSDWVTMEIPGYWADQGLGKENGVFWFRREVKIPEAMTGQAAQLWMGRIVDADELYVNGIKVGATTYKYPPRRYSVNPDVLKAGKNSIAIRVVNNSGKGGFIPNKPYYLAVGSDTIDLEGRWKYRMGASMESLRGQTFIRWKPGGLYNRMIAPLTAFPIKGVIWYQGESNASKPVLYGKTFPALINNWREKWGQGDFPFIYVQLANYMKETPDPVESDWAALRQSQLNTLAVPNTAMAVIIDLGEWNDIHPLNKKDVGDRLAQQSRKLAYEEKDLIASGPIPVASAFNKKEVRITFEHGGKGLVAKDNGPLAYFAISNDGKHFVWANADIKGDQVRIWNKEIKHPIVVRYGWANNPNTANLYSKNGLPATPFEVRKD